MAKENNAELDFGMGILGTKLGLVDMAGGFDRVVVEVGEEYIAENERVLVAVRHIRVD